MTFPRSTMTASGASRISRNWTQPDKAMSRVHELRAHGSGPADQENHEHKKELDASASVMNGEWKLLTYKYFLSEIFYDNVDYFRFFFSAFSR